MNRLHQESKKINNTSKPTNNNKQQPAVKNLQTTPKQTTK